MNQDERWTYLTQLDDELLKGGVILSEWCSFVTKEVDIAFVHEAHLAAILLAVSAVETHLRSDSVPERRAPLVELIDSSELPPDLKADLHSLRRYRNKWVHVNEPWNDEPLLENLAQIEQELEAMAMLAVQVLRRTLYANPWV